MMVSQTHKKHFHTQYIKNITIFFGNVYTDVIVCYLCTCFVSSEELRF